MKAALRVGTSRYFHSWWIPGCLIALIFAGSLATTYLPAEFDWLGWVLLPLLGLSYLGFFANVIYQLVRKKWLGVLLQVALLAVILPGSVVLAFLVGMSQPDTDHFADHLTIPTNIEIADPLPMTEAAPGGAADTFQKTVEAALQVPGSDDSTLTADVPALSELQEKAPKILRRYLATSIAWRVFDERGNTFATRRWMIGPHWTYALNGYYGNYDFGEASAPDSSAYQSRVTIDFFAHTWAPSWNYIKLTRGQPTLVRTRIDNQQPSSMCVLPLDGLQVELFEQSAAKERRLTKAYLQFLQTEFQSLAADPTWENIQKLVPPGSIVSGQPSLNLRNSFEPGIYTSEIRMNPGEPGMVYLKAFEVTHGTPLSTDRLKEDSSEYVGWSSDPQQQLFSNANFTIYEGDWGKPYAARFEVWFVPDSGKPERKLLERNFRIEGWER